MNRSNLLKQIRSFTPKEMREFHEYILSPYFNKNKSVIKLFDYIRKQYPVFDEKKLEKEIVFVKIFPQVEYNDGFMRTIIFNLSNLADDYLAHKQYKQNYFTSRWFLLYELNERMLDKQIEKNLKEINDKFDEIKVHDSDYFMNKFLIENEYFYFINRQNLDKTEKFIERCGITDMFNHLTYFYLLRSFKLFEYNLNAKDIINVDFKTELFEEIFSKLDPDTYKEVPAIRLYYYISMLHIRREDTSNYFKVKQIVSEIENSLNKYVLATAYVNLENYCKARIRGGDKNFIPELFEILKTELAKGLHKTHGFISAKFYRCVVDTALKLEEFEWVSKFIEDNKKELSALDMDNTYNYVLAQYEFARKNFSRSLEYISLVKYDEIYQKAEVRCLSAQLYYELEMDEVLLSHLDSFAHFLKNDRHLPEERKLFFTHFITYMRYILNLRFKPEKYDADLISGKIIKERSLINKEWLLEKLGVFTEVSV